MKPILISVLGPTAVGKTDTALWLAEELSQKLKLSVALVSADSRQVYQGLEVLSGADVPAEYVQIDATAPLLYPYFIRTLGDGNDSISIHGQSIIKPKQEWSVAHFRDLVQSVLKWAPIVIMVGGTGLYHDKALSTDPELNTPPDEDLRQELSLLSLAQLQQKVEELSPGRLAEMTLSDQSNPRRLIRAIELSQKVSSENSLSKNIDALYIKCGLNSDQDTLIDRITQRVQMRFEESLREVSVVADIAISDAVKLPALSATGVKELAAYSQGLIEKAECLELWTRREIQYAKRQRTWWKKQHDIEWFQALEPEMKPQLLKYILEYLTAANLLVY
jgi:tRNA dimethylallyltransferase